MSFEPLIVQGVFRVSTGRYRLIAGCALGSLCVIVVTGALVRLTGSGLGCADWPRCNESKFVDISSGHTLIEQANRLFTGVVSISVIAAVLSAHLRSPSRRDLVLLSWGLVFGVLAQVVIGGIVVLTGLNPFANMAHFLVSMLLVTCGLVLFRRAGQSGMRPILRHANVRPRWLLGATYCAGMVAVVTGTVVTATGPHAGDEEAIRFGFALESVARVHSGSVLLVVALLLLVSRQLMRGAGDTHMLSSLQTTLFVAILQGAIGYTQYFTDVPVQLVALHIVGAIAFVLSLTNLILDPEDLEPQPQFSSNSSRDSAGHIAQSLSGDG